MSEPAMAYPVKMSCFFHATRVGVSDYSQKAKLLDALTQVIEDSRAVDLLVLLCPAGIRDGELRIIGISSLIIRINQKPSQTPRSALEDEQRSCRPGVSDDQRRQRGHDGV